MTRKGWAHVLIWSAVVAAGLVLPALQAIEDRRLARAKIGVQEAERQQQLNEQLAQEAFGAMEYLWRINPGRRATTQEAGEALQALGNGVVLAQVAEPLIAPYELPGPTQRHRLTRISPPAHAFVSLAWARYSADAEKIAIPAMPAATNFRAIGSLIRRYTGILWFGLYVIWILSPCRRKVTIAYVLLVLAAWCLVSTLGHLRSPGWIDAGGGAIWLGVTLGSGILLAYSHCLLERPDLRRCAKCGYDLSFNTSGICPECGTDLSAAQKLYLYAAREEWKEARGKAHS